MGETKNPSPRALPEGWILYDDSCGICRRWVSALEGTLRKRGIDVAPLQAEWVVQRLHLGEGDLLHDVRMVLANGKQIQGSDIYRYAMRRIWWAYPLYLFSVMPLLRNIFDGSYKTFAAHRKQISRACGLPGKEEEP